MPGILRAVRPGKKLVGAARHWVGGNGGADELEEDARVFGIALPDNLPDPFYVVVPENWDVVRAFCACATQWRGGGGGLDYAGARAATRGLGIKWRRVFDGVRVMEAEALDALSQKSR